MLQIGRSVLLYSMASIFSSFDASILAPFSRSILTTSRWPDYTATCNGVHVSKSAVSLLAPGSSSILTTSKSMTSILSHLALPFSWSILTTMAGLYCHIPVSSLF